MKNTLLSQSLIHNKRSAKLTAEAVQEIRKRLASGESLSSIATDKEMSYTAIRWIQRGYSWRDLPWENEKQKQLAQQNRRQRILQGFRIQTKLTLATVQSIRQELRQGVPGSVLARKNNVSRQTISLIKLNKIWKKGNHE